MIVNETKPPSNGGIKEPISDESSLSSCKFGKNVFTKLEKRIRKHSNGYVKNDSTSLTPLMIAPLLSTNATLLSALPSLPQKVPATKNKDESYNKTCCFLSDSPFYIHKIAQTERLDEFKRLYYEDPRRLLTKDNIKNWIPLHHAAFKNKINIMDFILNNSTTGKLFGSMSNPRKQNFNPRS